MDIIKDCFEKQKVKMKQLIKTGELAITHHTLRKLALLKEDYELLFFQSFKGINKLNS
jgi:hypothetical protein